jgi:hypothetical protein
MDFFRPKSSANPDPQCDAERPSIAIKLRSEVEGGCALPDWVHQVFGPPALVSGVDALQTGTGGGYEPPP